MYTSTHILVERGPNLKPISGRPPQPFDRLDSALVIGHQGRSLFPLQLTGDERLVWTSSSSDPVQTHCHTSHLPNFAGGTRGSFYVAARSRGILAGSQRGFTNSVWPCCRRQTPRFHVVRHSTDSYSTVQHTSIGRRPFLTSWMIFTKKARGVRFCLATVVRG